jgi:hypothetical protein
MKHPTGDYKYGENKQAVNKIRENLCNTLLKKWDPAQFVIIPFNDTVFCPYIAMYWLGESIQFNILCILGAVGEKITPYQSFVIDKNLPYIILDWSEDHIQPIFQELPTSATKTKADTATNTKTKEDTGKTKADTATNTKTKEDTGKTTTLKGKKFYWTKIEIDILLAGNRFFDITTTHPIQDLAYLLVVVSILMV